jgi:hypothetical protein
LQPQVPFVQINQPVANKKVGNRSKNKMDVAELEKIRLLRKEWDWYKNKELENGLKILFPPPSFIC